MAVCSLISRISTATEIISVRNNGNWCTRAYDNGDVCIMYGLTEEDLESAIISSYKLSSVIFQGCNITTWPILIKTNSQFVDVQNISLPYNGIKNIQKMHFEFVNNLVNLALTFNRIEHLSAFAFEHVSTVRHLHLDFNEITTIDEDAFSGLPQLENLWLGNNNISYIAASVFDHLILNTLSLNENKLEDIGHIKFPDVRRLELVGNYMKTGLPQLLDLANSSHFKELDMRKIYFRTEDLLSCREFKRVQAQLKKKGVQVEVWLNKCGVNFYGNDSLLCPKSHAKECYIIFSTPQELERRIHSTYNVTNLNIYGDIADLPSHIKTTSSFSTVISIDLAYCNITNIEKIKFDFIDSLAELKLSLNNIRELRAFVFQDVSTIRDLLLEYNKIEIIHKNAFHGLTNLRILAMNYNEIKHLDPLVFHHLRNVRTMYLESNRLEDISEVVFPNSLIEVDLSFSRNIVTRQLSKRLDIANLEQIYLNGICYKSVNPNCCNERKQLHDIIKRRHTQIEEFFDDCTFTNFTVDASQKQNLQIWWLTG